MWLVMVVVDVEISMNWTLCNDEMHMIQVEILTTYGLMADEGICSYSCYDCCCFGQHPVVM